MASFGIKRTLDVGFDEALARIPGALKAEGFGVLTEIDVQQTLKSKLGVDFRRYRILGACNPPLAHKVLEHSLDIGMLLPCNVIVYEADDGRTVVSAIDPVQTLAAQEDEAVKPIAAEVQRRLRKVVDGL